MSISCAAIWQLAFTLSMLSKSKLRIWASLAVVYIGHKWEQQQLLLNDQWMLVAMHSCMICFVLVQNYNVAAMFNICYYRSETGKEGGGTTSSTIPSASKLPCECGGWFEGTKYKHHPEVSFLYCQQYAVLQVVSHTGRVPASCTTDNWKVQVDVCKDQATNCKCMFIILSVVF